MPKTIDFEPFIKWVMEKPQSRMARIVINPVVGLIYEKPDNLRVWVHDCDVQMGDFVCSVEEIDLEARCAEQEMMEYEKLRAKFEPRKEAVT